MSHLATGETTMMTDQMHDEIDRMLCIRPMFSASLQRAAYIHGAILDEVVEMLEEWPVQRTVSRKVLRGLGYDDAIIADASRVLAARKKEAKLIEDRAEILAQMEEQLDMLESAFDVAALLPRARWS